MQKTTFFISNAIKSSNLCAVDFLEIKSTHPCGSPLGDPMVEDGKTHFAFLFSLWQLWTVFLVKSSQGILGIEYITTFFEGHFQSKINVEWARSKFYIFLCLWFSEICI